MSIKLPKPPTALLSRRGALRVAAGAAAATALAAPAIRASAQGKPDKLVCIVPSGHWPLTIVEDVGPAFEAATGIRVEFTTLPADAVQARGRAEFAAGGGGIDIYLWAGSWAGGVAPFLEDHAALLDAAGEAADGYDIDDFLPSVRELASYEQRLCGIPYRVTMSILHYQAELLRAAGFEAPPGTFDEFLRAAQELTRLGAPDRFGVGIIGRQGGGTVPSFGPWLMSNGGSYFAPDSYDVTINDTAAVEALDFYGELLSKHRVIPPEATTWEFDEIVAGGQNDRYAMSSTYAPYGTALNNPAISRTGNRWLATTTPGATDPAQGRTWLSGWTLSVPASSRYRREAFEFILMATNKEWMQKSLAKGNLPPRSSVLNDPRVADLYPWTPAAEAAMRTASLDPRFSGWTSMEAQLRPAIVKVLLGESTAKSALDAVALDWERTLRRSGLR